MREGILCPGRASAARAVTRIAKGGGGVLTAHRRWGRPASSAAGTGTAQCTAKETGQCRMWDRVCEACQPMQGGSEATIGMGQACGRARS